MPSKPSVSTWVAARSTRMRVAGSARSRWPGPTRSPSQACTRTLGSRWCNQPGEQPPGTRPQGRVEKSVIGKRAHVHEQVPDPGLSQPGGQSVQVTGRAPPIDPGMPQPKPIATTNMDDSRHRPSILSQQGAEPAHPCQHRNQAGHANHDHHPPPRPEPPPPAASPSTPTPAGESGLLTIVHKDSQPASTVTTDVHRVGHAAFT